MAQLDPSRYSDAPLKCPSGIDGLDDITQGGLPRGRTTLVYGGAGCGKTLFALQFLTHGVECYGESGVLISFEEDLSELAGNARSIGCDIRALIDAKKLYVDRVDLHHAPQEESGEFNLDGLFFRIAAGIEAVGAQRIAIDSIEALFSRFGRQDIVRLELYRLHRWLKDRGITAVVTGEAGHGTLTRHGIEEYISDAVIHLDHRVQQQIATRRLRVVKLRGSGHGTNEYPFTISERGLAVLPITKLALEYPASTERISSGIARLDTMLDGAGFFRGSSVLVSGTAGTGKSSLAMSFVAAACQRGARATYFAFEEAPQQIVRNMASIGLDLQPLIDRGLLHFQANRATSFGLETHLAKLIETVRATAPEVIVIDPISNLATVGPELDVKVALTRVIDFLKREQITSIFTDLSGRGSSLEATAMEISSLMDTWILLRDLEYNGERNRGLYILKSRGMAHSNQIRELKISARGLELLDVYTGPGGVVTGTARLIMEAKEQAERKHRERKVAQLQQAIRDRQLRYEQELDAFRNAFETELDELEQSLEETQLQESLVEDMTRRLSDARGLDPS